MRGTPNTSRRHALFAAATSVVIGSGITAGAAASVADFVPADTDLITACNEYLRIQRAFSAYCESYGDSDIKDDDPNWSMLDPIPALRNRIIVLTATTAEGHLARARCMAFSLMPNHSVAQDDPDGAPEDRFRAALYRDLIAQEWTGRA